MSIMNKIRIIIATIIGIFIIIVVILVINIKNNVVTNNTENNTSQNIADKKILNMDDDFIEIVYQTTRIDNDWSNLPLSKKFKAKYNSKNGILNDRNISNISGGGNSDKKKQIVVLNVFHNSKKEEYYIHYILNNQNELDDVEIVDKKLLYDEEGNEVIYKRDMNVTWIGNIIDLAIPWTTEWDPFDHIYVTENYKKKWSGGFVPLYDCKHFDIREINDLCNKDKKEVYLDIDYGYYNEEDGLIISTIKIDKRYYKVHYLVNNDMWLDDVEVEEVSKEEIDKLLEEAKNN